MFVDAAGLSTHVSVDGPADAPALVLLHSLGTSAAVWDPQAEALAGPFRVIRPDLRGHGLTDVTPGPYTIEGMARDVLAALDAMHVDRFHLAGLSIGGMIAQSVAVQAPGRVRSLMLCDTAMAIPPANLWHGRAAMVRTKGLPAIADAVLARWLTAPRQQGPQATAVRTMLLRTPPEGYAAAAEAIAAADLTPGTATLRLPTLVIIGDQDEGTPLPSAEAMRDTIPGARLSIVPDAAHIPTIEQPAATTAALQRFLQELPA